MVSGALDRERKVLVKPSRQGDYATGVRFQFQHRFGCVLKLFVAIKSVTGWLRIPSSSSSYTQHADGWSRASIWLLIIQIFKMDIVNSLVHGKMVDILQAIFSKAFSQNDRFVFEFKFQWGLFLLVRLIINYHCCSSWLARIGDRP